MVFTLELVKLFKHVYKKFRKTIQMNFQLRSMRSLILILFFVFASSLGYAQDQEKPIQNTAFWGGTEMYMPLHEDSKWGLFAEGYVKQCNFFANPMGLFWRLGGSYYLKNGNRISGGVAYQYNYSYDEAMLPYAWPDWRIWQQYMIRKQSKKNPEHMWVHRLRPEERWFGRRYDDSQRQQGWDYYKFELTFRYMLRSQWYVAPRFGIAVYDEIHLRLASSEPNEKLVDQNRLYGGVIFALDEKREWRIETGYMFQSVWNAADEERILVRMNHTWRVTLTADVALCKSKKEKRE